MSRSQQQQVLNQATGNSTENQAAATKARDAETQDIGNYESQLSKYASENPYLQGGEYDTATQQKLSGVADAGAGALTNQLQTQARRTGQNAASANATAAEAARANERELSAAEADATQRRIAGKAGYDQSVLGASEVPAQLEAGMYATSLGGANSALNTAADSARTPGFWDTLGSSFASALGTTAGGGNLRFTKQL